MTEAILSYFSTDGHFVAIPATTSAGQLVQVSNPSTAVTVSNISTAVTITNPTTAVSVLSSGPITGTVNTLSSGPVLVLSSGPATIAGTVTVLSASSGLVQISGTPTVIAASSAGHQVGSLTSGTVTLSSAPLTIVASSAGFGALSGASVSTAVNIVGAAGAAVVTSSYGVETVLFGADTPLRLRVVTSVGSISTAPGVLTYFNAYSTAAALAGQYVRLYDQTTGNATSANNSGLAGAVGLFRIASSVSGGSFDATHSFVHGLKFATACSFDIVVNATSTAANATAGWLTAQYTT